MPILQGRVHWPGCKCLQCAKFHALCNCCDPPREFNTFPGLRRHQTAKPKQKRGSKNPPRAAVVPNGLGFLERVLANQEQLQKYNLSVISRFCAALNDMRPGNYSGRFTRSHKRILDEVSKSDTNSLLPFRLDLPTQQAQAVLKLCQSVNVSPTAVLALLVQYGLEHLSNELRVNSVAPPIGDPNIKKTLTTVRQSAAQEFLKEESKTHVVIEYSSPTNPEVSVNRSRFIPTSTKG